MKKCSVISLVLVLALLAGCGGGGGSSSGKYVPGTLDGDTYTNEYIGYSYTLPEGWSFASQEDLDEMMDAGGELLNEGQKAGAEYAKIATIYDMMAQSPEGCNIIVMLDNLKLYVGGTGTSVEDYIDNLVTQLEAVSSMSYTYGEVSQVNVFGHDWSVLPTELTGTGIVQTYNICRIDDYIAAMIVTSDKAEPINEIAGMTAA